MLPCFSNCTFSNGHASDGGGGLYLKYQYSEKLLSCSSTNIMLRPRTPWLYRNHIPWYILPGYWYPFAHRKAFTVVDIRISVSHFLNNSGGGGGGVCTLFMISNDYYSYTEELCLSWAVKDCTFHGNEGIEGAGIYASLPKSPMSGMEIHITGCKFNRNVFVIPHLDATRLYSRYKVVPRWPF